MDNPAWGILTILLSVSAYLLSYYHYRRDKYLRAISLLMLGGCILRLFTACDFFLHPWDEAFHAVVAKHMMHHPFIPTLYENPVLPYDYKNWAGNHIWLHKQPLPLWTMALSMSVFGVNELALRLPSILLTTMGIALTYYIGQYFFDRRTGYLAAFFYSVNGLIIEMTAGRVATDHVDVFFLFFVELAIFFSIVFARRGNVLYNVAAGFCIGAAILCKWLPALIVLPIWLLVVFDSKRFAIKEIVVHFLLLIAILVATSLPWQIYIHMAFPLEAKWEGSYNTRHLFESIENHSHPFYYYIDRIRINYGELIYLPLIWLIIKRRSPYPTRILALIFWIYVPLLFFSLVKTKMQGYVLFISPALFIITSAFFFSSLDSLNKKTSSWKTALTTILLVLFIVLPIRYCYERTKPFLEKRKPEWVTDLKSLPNATPKCVLFNYPAPIDAMFYTDIPSYPFIPDSSQVNALNNSGYRVYINDNQTLNISHKSFSANIVWVNLKSPKE